MLNRRKLILFVKKAYTYILRDGFDAASSIAYDTFTRANGAIGSTETTDVGGAAISSYAWTGSTYTISTNKAICTPATLSAEKIVNGGFGADTDWTKGSGWTIAAGVASASTATSNLTAAVNPLTANKWYQTAYTVSNFSAGTIRAHIGSNDIRSHAANGTYTETYFADSGVFALKGIGFTGDIDNISAKELTLSELMASISIANSDVVASVAVTLTSSTTNVQGGLVVSLDAAGSPANFVIAYLDGNDLAKLDKYVAGTRTSIISAGITYVAGATMKVVKSGTSYSLYYNGAQVGTTQTISDAGIISNTLHGLLSTSSGNTLDNFNLSNLEVAPTRTAKPGPGTLTVTDTNCVMSTSGGRLVVNGTTVANDGIITPSAPTRAAGLAFLVQVPVATTVGTNVRCGWETTGLSLSNIDYGFDFNSASQIRIKSGTSIVDTYNITSIAAGAEGNFAIIQRGTGGFLLYRSAATSTWTLLWVYALLSTNLFAKLWHGPVAVNYKVDDFRITQLSAPWSVANGIATAVVASPMSGQVSTMTADAIVEFSWTIATNEVLRLDVRRTDVDNRWIVEADQAGSTFRLIERNAGVETTRASNSRAFTNATTQRIVAVCEGASIKTWQGLTSIDNLSACANYASATLNQTATGVAVAGFATGANLITWPRTITSIPTNV